ncbi:hypothetical protein DMENIID0001_109550 [Sergentomyia squamirostris]
MELISCGKSICLHHFPSLETLSSHGQESRACYDFQFFRKSNFFIASNLQSGALEYFSLKLPHDGIENVTLLKRIHMENLSCIACPKNNLEYIATGFSTGQINLMNYKTKEISYRFNPGTISNSIVSMDFSCTDDYLASALETGDVKVYGMKSFIEVDSFNIDKNTTLVRYHPTKRFQLMLSSHLGSVTLYDGQAKKKIFHVNRAHTTPCRDFVASHINETCLFSAGLDCYINIYDTRKKAIVQQVKTEHPLSTITLSPTSLECIVGNLKGELVVFDARKMLQPVKKAQVHNGLVARLAFVPPEKNNSDIAIDFTTPVPEDESIGVGSSLNDSVDVFDMLPWMKKDKANNEATTRRDSFMEFLQSVKTDENSRRSMDFEKRRSLSRRSLTRSNQDSEEEKENLIDQSNVTLRKKKSTSHRRSTRLFSKISEEGAEEAEENQAAEIKTDQCVEENEENVPVENSDELYKTTNSVEKDSPVGRHSTPNPIQEPTACTSCHGQVLKQELAELIRQSENSIVYDMTTLKWQSYGEMFSLWQSQNRSIERINEKVDDLCSAMAMILRNEDFVTEFNRLQQENETLKQQLANMSSRYDSK